MVRRKYILHLDLARESCLFTCWWIMLTFPPRENLSTLLQDGLFTCERYLAWCVHRARLCIWRKNEITKEPKEDKIEEVDMFCGVTFLHLFVLQSQKGEVLRTAFPRPLLEIASFAPCVPFSLLWQGERTEKQAMVFNFSLFLARPSFMVSMKSAM